MLPAEHIYAATTMSKVNHLLPGDFTWTDADPFLFNAMVTA